MPRVFDNIDQDLLPALRDTLGIADRADFCVGYFNLRGWKQIDHYVERWSGGPGHCCRLLVGMQRLPQDDLRAALSFSHPDDQIDQATAIRLKKELAQRFREQLAIGAPTNEDEAGLRRLALQIRSKKLVVKLYLRHALHAKLYLLFRPDPISPTVGYLGSSNLTFAGLSGQGELNIDVVDVDACDKLATWFESRWGDRFCIDISEELADIIEHSWAAETPPPPYHIYLKMAYHLCDEARTGLREFQLPPEFERKLFEFQKAAVKIAAHHVNRRDGVIVGDVVGLGKTLVATALAAIIENDFGHKSLIVCPKNLVPMWERYRERYGLRGKVVSISRAEKDIAQLSTLYRLVIIDESHNLRNREGKRYKVLADYIRTNDCKVVLLSATPYNKAFLDISNQLRLFIEPDADIGIRPERIIRELGEAEFTAEYQCPLRSLRAFEKSEYADDWRDLMRLYLVRRTRGFIKDNYTKVDEASGRRYLEFSDGRRGYFPERIPKTVQFEIDESDPDDQYASLFAPRVVDTVNHLKLPRYGLGNYQAVTVATPPTNEENRVLGDLSRAGSRLKGFCRTNLFKRLESSGYAFILSVERHILRNYINLHAIENDLPLPIGTQDMGLLDANVNDADTDLLDPDIDADLPDPGIQTSGLRTEQDFKNRAAEIYDLYASKYKRRFKWLRANLFDEQLGGDLFHDVKLLAKVLADCGDWDWSSDAKLDALIKLVKETHADDKILIFTQFADTVEYLEDRLKALGVQKAKGVTGDSENPTAIAWRFSPKSNEQNYPPEDEFRVVIATDVLSEGQNLQDCSIIVNYDLPWAIIRLIQRAGRVDRIGQEAERILCYSFLPADGVERIINLRGRVRQRLRQNAEVVGADEAFFDDDPTDMPLFNLYHEKAGILDGDDETEVDLSSYAYQIWKNATDADPSLVTKIESLDNVVFSTKPQESADKQPEGALVYLRTGDGNNALAWIDRDGKSVTESQFTILKAAACEPATPALTRHDNHHDLVRKAVEHIAEEEKSVGGQLGRPSGARRKAYDRLMKYAQAMQNTLIGNSEFGDKLRKAIDEIYKFPLMQTATDALNRQLKAGIDDHGLAELVVLLRDENRLCRVSDAEATGEPQIICSMGLRAP